MIRAKHDKTRAFDAILSRFINQHVKSTLLEKDDDVLVLCVGETGSGKSMLMLHAYEEFSGVNASVNNISFNRENLADNLDLIKKLPIVERFNGYDEANVSKRDAQTKFNKALLDVYYTIRGLNMFHWWNNPSLEMIDKPFIKDRVTGVFLITTKCVKRPRTYYYFKKNDLLTIFKKYKNLDYDTLNRVKKKYSTYKGWFKDYKGFLKAAYLDKKNPRMAEKVSEFKKQFGTMLSCDEHQFLYTPRAVSTISGFSVVYLNKLRSNKVIPPELFVKINPTLVKFKKSIFKFLYDWRISKGTPEHLLTPEFRRIAHSENDDFEEPNNEFSDEVAF